MHKQPKSTITMVVCLLVAAIAAPAITLGLEEPAQDEEERFRAIAVVMGNRATGRNSNVDIVVTRWTTEEERTELLGILMSQDNTSFRNALGRQESAGWIRMTGGTSTRHHLRYARTTPDPETGGRTLLLATDRIIPFVEAWNRPRSFDYDVSLIQMKLDENDEGSGVAAVGVRFIVGEDNTLTIENFGTQPVNLNAVRRTN